MSGDAARIVLQMLRNFALHWLKHWKMFGLDLPCVIFVVTEQTWKVYSTSQGWDGQALTYLQGTYLDDICLDNPYFI